MVQENRSDIAVTGQRVRTPNAETFVNTLPASPRHQPYQPSPDDRERYAGEAVANVIAVAEAPVSTFAVDVDTGSYSNVRRLLNAGATPPQAAVRTEEMLNYFRYDYPLPQDRSRPFSITTDMTTTPWNPNTRLLRVGLRGYDLPRQGRPPANLVFLVDVSGSMGQIDKLPLVQCSLALLADRLNRAGPGLDRRLCRRRRPGAGADVRPRGDHRIAEAPAGGRLDRRRGRASSSPITPRARIWSRAGSTA